MEAEAERERERKHTLERAQRFERERHAAAEAASLRVRQLERQLADEEKLLAKRQKLEKASEKQRSQWRKQHVGALKLRTRVVARHTDGYYYVGSVAQKDGDAVMINWDDGDTPSKVEPERVALLTQQAGQLAKGQQVVVRWRDGDGGGGGGDGDGDSDSDGDGDDDFYLAHVVEVDDTGVTVSWGETTEFATCPDSVVRRAAVLAFCCEWQGQAQGSHKSLTFLALGRSSLGL